ncbi:MAG: hypothetical protein ACOYOF_21210 [Verrucomicrobiaceae bacterium]
MSLERSRLRVVQLCGRYNAKGYEFELLDQGVEDKDGNAIHVCSVCGMNILDPEWRSNHSEETHEMVDLHMESLKQRFEQLEALLARDSEEMTKSSRDNSGAAARRPLHGGYPGLVGFTPLWVNWIGRK